MVVFTFNILKPRPVFCRFKPYKKKNLTWLLPALRCKAAPVWFSVAPREDWVKNRHLSLEEKQTEAEWTEGGVTAEGDTVCRHEKEEKDEGVNEKRATLLMSENHLLFTENTCCKKRWMVSCCWWDKQGITLILHTGDGIKLFEIFVIKVKQWQQYVFWLHWKLKWNL